MNNLNYVFFEEYTRLDKLCKDIYGTDKGVSNYINDMMSASWSDCRYITNWKTDLAQLKRIRHLRNRLAHETGAFSNEICTQNDIDWIKTFHKCILNQSDPIALLHKNKHNKPVQQKTIHYPSIYTTSNKKQGCYIATCIYGSYDCPQVWTLRRYRDYILLKNWYGKMFIYFYYALSPILVKWFGNSNWFRKLWHSQLDYIVKRLNSKGIENTPYNDNMV